MPQSTEFHRRATVAYIAPFLAFVGIMALERMIPLPPQWLYLVRFLVVVSVIGAVSWPYLSFRPSFPLASIAVGVAVFVIWVAPDLLFGYRHHWLFENALTGCSHRVAASSFEVQPRLHHAACCLLRDRGAHPGGTVLARLADALADRQRFPKVPLGTYVPFAFWIVALLFASEHGPYWEVGLAAGIIYNWWMVRTRTWPIASWRMG